MDPPLTTATNSTLVDIVV